MDRLKQLGWTDELDAAFAEYRERGLVSARVVSVHGRYYRVLTDQDEVLAEVPKKIKHKADSAAGLPAIGDWTAIELLPEKQARFHAILPRKSRFSRKVAGEELEEQVIAANIDTLFVMQ